MVVKFTDAGLSFLFRTLVSPQTLQPCQPYTAPDTPAAMELIGLKKWLLDEKATPRRATIDEARGQWVFAKDLTVRLNQHYITRMLELTKHYQAAGMMITNVEGYQELCASLAGTTVKVEAVEEEEIEPDLPTNEVAAEKAAAAPVPVPAPEKK